MIKKFPILLMSILFVSLFWPCSYTMQVEPTEINLLTRRTRGETGTDCSSIVETISLDAEDYKKLLDLANNSVFDGFGNVERYDEQEELNEADVSLNPGVNDAKNQFIMTDSGPMFVFDTMQHSARDPSVDSTCYLNNIVTNGYMSYSTKVDQIIRFCSEYGDSACENGRYDESLLEEDQNIAREMLEFSKYTNPISYGADAIMDVIDEAEVESHWASAKEVYDNLPDETKEKIGDWESFRTRCENDPAECSLTPYIPHALAGQLGLNKDEATARGTWNNIQSNHSDLWLTQADTILMIPHNLIAFINDLKDLKFEENLVTIISIAGAAASVTNIYQSYKIAKAHKAAVAVGKKAKALTEVASPETWAASFKSMIKTAEASGNTEIVFKYTKMLDELEKTGDVSKVVGEGAQFIGKDGATLTPSKLDDVIKHIEQTQGLGGFPKGTPASITRMQRLQSLYKSDAVWKTAKPNEIAGLEKIVSGSSDLLKNADTTGDLLKGFTFSDDTVKGLTGASKAFTVGAESGAEAGKIALKQGASSSNKLLGLLETVEESYKTAKAWSAAKAGWGLARFGLKWMLGINNIFRFARIQALITFAAQQITGDPGGFYQVSSVAFMLKPSSKLVGAEGSYVDLVITKDKVELIRDKDIYPDGFFTNIIEFLGVNLADITGPTEVNAIQRKINSIGDIVSIVDQETGAVLLTQSSFPTNLMTSHTDDYGKQRWFFHSVNPDNTLYYGFEDPKEYQISGENKYTAMGLISNNVNISGTSSVEKDWATYGEVSSTLTKFLPSTLSVMKASIIGGLFTPIAGMRGQVGRGALALMAAQAFGGTLSENSAEIREQTYGQLVDIEAAFESGIRCGDVRDENLKEIEEMLHIKTLVSSVALGLEVAEIILAPTPAGAALFMASQIAVGITDYWASEQYVKLKEDGLAAMKGCYETQYEYLAWQKIPTQQGAVEGFEEEVTEEAIQSFQNTFGATLSAISPQVREAIQELGESYYASTLHIRADPIQGKSIISMFGTEVYQVHFDRESEFKWFAENTCPIQICDETAEGYKCITKQGYFLFDSNGNMIFDGPQAAFFSWSNLETYAGMPQKIINVAQNTDKLMDIYDDSVVFSDPCVTSEVAKNLGVETDSGKIGTAFGDLQNIVTDEAIIWFDTTQVVTTFLKAKTCGENKFYEAQTVRVDNGYIELYKDGKVKTAGTECEFDIGERGTIAFENGLIVQGKGDSITKEGTNYNISEDYNKLGDKDVLHLVIKDLLTFDRNNLENIGIADFCECVKDAEGITCTTEEGQSGGYLGFKLEGSLLTENSEQFNNLLADICFTGGTGQNGEKFSFSDGMFCITLEDGTEKCTEIDPNPIDPFCLDGLLLADGSCYKIENGPDGPEWWRYLNGIKTADNPIPIMWMNGMGGSMFNNPETGRISIKNEFPFAINPSFNQYGALATGGFAVPGTPPWGGNIGGRDEPYPPVPKPNIMAQLPLLPENPMWLMVFIISMLSSLIFVRIKYTKEE